jgi:hypothetical protein
MVTADHHPRKDDGGSLGQRFCQSGLEVVGDHPKPTWRTPMHPDTTNASGGTCFVAGQTSNQARCAVSSTGMLWWQGIAGCAVQDINKWSVVNTRAEGRKQWRSGKLSRWLPIFWALVVLATDK